MRLEDKVAIVTGSARGIGEAIASRLCAEGAKVVISDIDLPAAQDTSARLNSEGYQTIAVKANVGSKPEVEAMVKAALDAFGSVDILVNNAGMSVVGASEDLEEKRWRQGIDVMLTGVFFCSQAAGKVMIKQRSGKIINISSINGIGAFPERVAYNSAKAGVMGLTRTLGCEWARYNINVNAVAPGYVNTYLTQDLVAKGTLDLTEIETRTPLGRLAETDDIADAVIFLASEDSKYMTGHTMAVDGGWSAYGYLQSWLEQKRPTDD
ncbi:MAG: glucose 1-dehydrogenase [Dehalococcoidia bacterium]|jgi:NAD(P)-dependent dehydrogenase (short-subunit alcohol dehydrogenase family)